MDERTLAPAVMSPYRHFKRAEWAALRADTPLTLTIDDLTRLQSMNDPISVEEVVAIYLPLSRLLALYVAATQGLFKATQRFLGAEDGKVPYIIGIAGSVAVGKSTAARVLTALMSRWPNTPKVQLVTTDGFLLPNSVLQAEGIMDKKGFPESYDGAALLRFLSQVKAGEQSVTAPAYSHLTYDVVQGKNVAVDHPDILIVEGLNVLQPSPPGRDIPFVSDFFDFSIYLHAGGRRSRALVCVPLHAAARNGFPRPAIVFPEIRRTDRRRSARHSARHLDADQSAQPAGKHLADEGESKPGPHEGIRPPHRGSRTAQTLADQAPRPACAASSESFACGLAPTC